MTIDDILTGNLGKIIAQEIQTAINPVTKRTDALEKKLDSLILTCQRIETLLNSMQPLVKLLNKLPFFK